MQADLTVQRAYHSDATIGRIFSTHFKKYLALLELPWLGNTSERSCIPEGLYDYHVAPSPRLNGKMVIWIDGVADRTNIQWHPGNYTRQILGCGLPGYSVIDMDNDGIPDVTRSGDALDYILSHIPKRGKLRVTAANQPGVGVYR